MYFGVPVTSKWFVTYEFKGVTYYLASAEQDTRHLIWTQQPAKALKFESSGDAETMKDLIKLHRKNKKLIYKVK